MTIARRNKLPLLFILVALSSIVLKNSSVGSSPVTLPADSASLGKFIYQSRCAMCHGFTGSGNGPAAVLLNPRPRDFTTGIYKFRTTETGSIPTDADLERTIRDGLHSTSMPEWKDFLQGDSLKAIVTYIKSLSPRFQNERPKPLTINPALADNRSNRGAGRKIYDRLQCQSCHGTDGNGNDAVALDLEDAWGNPAIAANLTEPWTFRGGSTTEDVYVRIRTGIDGTPMPSYSESASEQEIWEVAQYVLSLARKPVWSMNEPEIKKFHDELNARAKANPIAHGRYLVTLLGCQDCHSPIDNEGYLVEKLSLAGGMKWSTGPYGVLYSANLTSDKETGLGNWTDEEIKRGITQGIRKDGSRSIPFPMPWTSYANLTSDDLNAVVAYLRSVPPIYNKVPEPQPLNIFAYLWGKFKMLILKQDFASRSYTGNSGSTKKEMAQ